MQAQSSSPPPTPPAPPAPPAHPGAEAPRVDIPATMAGASAADIYTALRAQRRELARQLESLEERRGELSERLEEPMVRGADRSGLEQRIAEMDQRIANVDRQLAATDGEIARTAAIPGAVVEPRPPRAEGPSEEAAAIGIVFTMFVLFPLSFAYARRLWRRGTAAVVALPAELAERLTRLEQAVDTVAVEVERISEGQRFVTKLFAEGGARSLGPGAAQPIDARAAQAEPVPRSVRSGG